MKVTKDDGRDQESSDIKRKGNDDGSGGIRRGGVQIWDGHGHAQGGIHEEMPLPAILVVDGAADYLAKARVGFGVVKGEVT